ncbi:TolC family protein [Sphingobacterium sp.]|uniref:TolC family protein n=1 Tax=Sphingobacterium sp. TaxID=341027 RepID=UPI0031DB48CC
MKKQILAFSLLKLISLFMIMRVFGQESVAISAPSLQELVDSAIYKNFNLRNKQLDLTMTDVELQKAKDAFLPRITVAARDAFSYMSIGVSSKELAIPALNIDIKTAENRFNMSSNTLTAGAEISMLLYSGNRIPYSKKALTAKSEAQALIMETTRQQIISDVIEAYDQVALLKQVKHVLDEAAVRLAENKKTADKALAYGLTTKYEHQKIEVAQAQLASKLVDYLGKRELVLKQLSLLSNIEQERLNLMDNDLQTIDLGLQQEGIENRAEIKSLDAVIQAGRYKIQAEKTWFMPKVVLSGSVGYLGMFDRHISSSKPLVEGGRNLSADAPTFNIFPMTSIGIGVK